MVRAETVGTHPQFISMIRELILERLEGREKRCLGLLGPSHDVCPENCCPSGRPAQRPAKVQKNECFQAGHRKHER
jgi:ferrochelatase